jgi:hypothetical protein
LPSTIEQLHRTLGPRGLTVLAVNIEERREVVEAWVRKARVTVPVLLDPSGEVTRAWGVTATPTSFVVTRAGTVVGKAVGTRPWTGDRGRSLFSRLLDGT